MANAVVTQTGAELQNKTLLTEQDTGQELTGDLTVTGSIVGGDVQIGHLTQVTTVLTDAQIKALPTTPVTIIAAPGVAKRIELVAVLVYLNNNAGAYTNLNSTYASMKLLWHGTTDWASSALFNDTSVAYDKSFVAVHALDDLLAQAVIASWRPGVIGYESSFNDSDGILTFIMDATNKANVAIDLSLDNNGSGVLTGGNAANHMTVRALYWMVDVP